jgi:hypothetical protein
MGIIKLYLASIFLVICLLLHMSTGTALAQPEYVGEVCIEFYGHMGGRPPMRLHVLSHGTDTFQLVGKMPDGEGHFMPVHGAAVFEGNNFLLMTLKGSAAGVYSATYSLAIDLNSQTYNGSITGLQTIQVEAPAPGEPGFVTSTSSGGFGFCKSP